MAKQHPRDFRLGQWVRIAAPTIVATIVAVVQPRGHMEFPMPLYFVGAGVGLSLLITFLMVYGEDL